MNDLTEQWKKGELPSGWYYLKVNEELANYPVISECVDDFNLGLPISYFYDFDVAKIEQVLAPVPSYEEWVGVKQQRDLENKLRHDSDNKNWQLRTENAQLKELLKECQHILKEQNFYRNTPVETDTIYRTRCLKKQELLTKIDEALR